MCRCPFGRFCGVAGERVGDVRENQNNNDGDFLEWVGAAGFESLILCCFGWRRGLGFGTGCCFRCGRRGRFGVGWDFLFEALEFFNGGEQLIPAVPGERAVGAVEETLLTLDVLVERFEIGSVGAIGRGGLDVGPADVAVLFRIGAPMSQDGEVALGGMCGFEAADLPTRVYETIDEIGFSIRQAMNPRSQFSTPSCRFVHLSLQRCQPAPAKPLISTI